MIKKVVMLIASNRFRDEELFKTMEVLEARGINVTVASKKTGIISGILGGTVAVNTDYKNVSVNNFDAIVFVGGAGASEYFNDEHAKKLVMDFFNRGKVVAAICIAPSILANAGILKGRAATCYASESSNLRAKGVDYINENVVVDGRLITAKGPQCSEEFGTEIARALGAVMPTVI
jgi:protease I